MGSKASKELASSHNVLKKPIELTTDFFNFCRVPLTVDNLFVAYVNLEHRTDRRAEMETELNKMGWLHATYRESATKHPVHSFLGVPDSHINCLTKGIESGKPYICVFEDDFDFYVSAQEMEMVMRHLSHMDFDVFLLDPGSGPLVDEETVSPLFFRVVTSVSTAGYLCQAAYAQKLIENMKEGKRLLEKDIKQSDKYCIDRYWSELQKVDRWFRYHKRVGGQRASYSDTQQESVNYNNTKK